MKEYLNYNDPFTIASVFETVNKVKKQTNDNYQINEGQIVSTKLLSIERVILIGTQYSKSIQKFKEEGVITEYMNPIGFTYKTENNKVILNNENNTVTLTKDDVKNTIILMRSGYKDTNMCYALNEIKSLGILILNDVEPVKISNDKFNTAELLEKYDIPQPKFCLITSNDCTKEDHSKLESKIKKLYSKVNDDTKFVCKILHGHGGKGVFLCKMSNIVSICQCIFKLDNSIKLLVQEYKQIKDGDIRVNVVSLNGKQKIFDVSMRCHHANDFRTNLSLGNTLNNNITLTPEQEKLCLKTAKISGLVWAGIDLFPSLDGKNYIIEINGAPGPMSDINDEDAINVNYNFFKKLFNTINSLC